jgi:calcium-dependent protein kinase
MEEGKLTIFLNGDLSKKTKVHFSRHLSLTDLLYDVMDNFGVARTQKCRLYDSSGSEIGDEDIEYINVQEPLFFSYGEAFVKNSSLALYSEVKLLGKGGFGTVKLYRHRMKGTLVAIKFVNVDRLCNTDDVNRVYTEIQVLRELKHPNIVQLLEAFPLQNQICFVMEYCSGGELKKYVKERGPLPDEEVYSIGLQMCEAIRHCHYSNITHRDLKLENILFSNETCTRIKIVDFGIAGMFKHGGDGDRSDAGSLLFLAPEVLSRTDNSSSPALDVWSQGVIFYCLLTAQHPFLGESVRDTQQNIIQGRYQRLETFPGVQRPWRRLVRGMLKLDPKKRWSMRRVTDHLYRYRHDPPEELSDTSSTSEEEEVSQTFPANRRGGHRRSTSQEELKYSGVPKFSRRQTLVPPVIKPKEKRRGPK